MTEEERNEPLDPKDESSFMTTLMKWVSEAENADSETLYREEAEEDYDFFAGKQDSQEVLDELERQQRPDSTYNTIMPKVNMLVGIAAQGGRAPFVRGVGPEDDPLAELMNGAFIHFRRKIKAKEKENECFEHTVKSGRSLMYFYIDGENPFEPQIAAKRLPGRNVLIDPLSQEYDLSDARYIIIDQWYSEDDMRALWPQVDLNKISKSPTVGTSNPSYYDSVTEKYRVSECWYRKFSWLNWFQNPITGVVEKLDDASLKKFKQALAAGVPLPNGQMFKLPNPDVLEVVRRPSKSVFYCIFSGMEVIESGPSPYRHKHFPGVLFGAYKDENENRWFSVVNAMKSPQIGKNTMRRQLVHLLQTSPKGILVHEAGILLNEDEYDKSSSKPNFRMVVAKGQIDKYRFTQQPQIPPIYQMMDQAFEQDMKDISGIQDSLLGIQTSSREPGVTVKMRQETGLTVLYSLFENFRRSRMQCAEILLSMIQQYVKTPQILRIEGPEGEKLIQANTQLNPQLEGFNDLSAGQFDLYIDEGAENTTLRMAVAQMLTDFSQNNPGAIPPDVILEYSDVPYSTRQQVKMYQESMRASQQKAQQDEMAIKQAELQLKREELLMKSRIEEEKIAADLKIAADKNSMSSGGGSQGSSDKS